MLHAPNFDHVAELIHSRSIDPQMAENLARYATSGVGDEVMAASLCSTLKVTLERLPVAEWLGHDVGSALKQEAVQIVREIEAHSSISTTRRGPVAV